MFLTTAKSKDEDHPLLLFQVAVIGKTTACQIVVLTFKAVYEDLPSVHMQNLVRVYVPARRIRSAVYNFQAVPKRVAKYVLLSHRIASHRIASHRIASHRIASHRIASHRIASCVII